MMSLEGEEKGAAPSLAVFGVLSEFCLNLDFVGFVLTV